ncbi:MAG TPA: SMC-Scp complex subunit ScpB [Pirellulales bacterium]|jgi:segregation and condensation protein B
MATPQSSPSSPQTTPILSANDAPAESAGMSLDQLSRAFAAIVGKANSDASAPLVVVGESGSALPAEQGKTTATDAASEAGSSAAAEQADAEAIEVTPLAILEGALFVGHPDNVPLTAEVMAKLVRGATVEEIDGWVRQLNEAYAANACPYAIVSEGAGYRMVLRDEYSSLRNRFYGRIRSARLSPAAIEVLSLVAYNQPITGDDIGRLRGTPSGHILSQLVRRRLLQLKRGDTKPRKAHYSTTHRFLEVFNLRSLDDLPRSDELTHR